MTIRRDAFGSWVEIALCQLPDAYRVIEEAWNADYTIRVIRVIE